MIPIEHDRREIEMLLREKFPDMVGKSSQEWAAFLNEYTGLDVAHETPNSTAFDVWRKAIAEQGHSDVWPFTDYDVVEMKLSGMALAKAEKARVAALEKPAEG